MAELESLDSAAALLASSALDPLFCDRELPLRGVYHPRGFTVEITTNSPEVLAGAQESWGQYHQVFPEPPLQLRVGVLGTGNGLCPPEPTCRAWRNLMLSVADAENYSVCDFAKGLGLCWLTQAAAENLPYLRYYFLEACVLSMVTQAYLAPVHGACVRFQDRGVLLCGDSGAGKSSLAYACARRGWTFVSDDAAELMRNRKELTVLGSPHQIRLREASAGLFPELRLEVPTLRGTGELAIELSTAKVPGISTSLTSSVDYVVFLNRREPVSPCLIPSSKQTAQSWFEQVICYGEEEVRQAQRAILRKLLDKPVLELRYRDLDWAVDRLETLVREGA